MIKTKIIKTENAELLVVGGLPKDAYNIHSNEFYLFWCVNDSYDFFKRHQLPEGNWQLLGKLSEITDEQWRGIVPFKFIEGIYEVRYFLYNREYDYLATTAKKSGLSLIEANVKLVNQYGDKPADDDYSFFTDINITLKEAWQREEDQVFRNLVVFVKEV